MDSEPFPQWQMNIVIERLQQFDEGKITPVPLEEALASLDGKWMREKTLLTAADRIEAERSSNEVSDWHLEVLEERMALGAKGQDPALSAEEAFRQIRDHRKP